MTDRYSGTGTPGTFWNTGRLGPRGRHRGARRCPLHGTTVRRGTGLAPAILIAALVLTACGDPTVSGSGPVTSEDRDTSTFSAVSITGAADLEFEQGTETSVTVRAQDDILPLITTGVRDDTLVVDSTDKRLFADEGVAAGASGLG